MVDIGAKNLPGARTSCALLTIFTILLAWPSPPPALAIVVRPGYFALLFWFFWRTGRGSPELQGQAMQLVRGGFLLLCLGFSLSAIVYFAQLEPVHASFVYLREACERGAIFLLGTTLLSYGLMLWLPQVVSSHRLLGEHNARQRGALQIAETARTQLEQRLVDADRRGMLGELAASIAHDLRNPLTIVKGTAESLCRRARTNAEVAEHTDVIRRNIDKADRTIASLIDLARPRAVAPTLVSARELFEEVSSLIHVEVRRQKATLVVQEDDPGTDPQLLVDRTLLAQALLNLVLNALQASPSGGTVRLRIRPLQRAGRRAVALAVEDRGAGLPASIRAQLFTPFFTTKQTGTGLGLLSCRRIATELGGRLGLSPRHRGGARALLLLPLANDHQAMPAPPTADEEARCPARSS